MRGAAMWAAVATVVLAAEACGSRGNEGKSVEFERENRLLFASPRVLRKQPSGDEFKGAVRCVGGLCGSCERLTVECNAPQKHDQLWECTVGQGLPKDQKISWSAIRCESRWQLTSSSYGNKCEFEYWPDKGKKVDGPYLTPLLTDTSDVPNVTGLYGTARQYVMNFLMPWLPQNRNRKRQAVDYVNIVQTIVLAVTGRGGWRRAAGKFRRGGKQNNWGQRHHRRLRGLSRRWTMTILRLLALSLFAAAGKLRTRLLAAAQRAQSHLRSSTSPQTARGEEATTGADGSPVRSGGSAPQSAYSADGMTETMAKVLGLWRSGAIFRFAICVAAARIALLLLATGHSLDAVLSLVVTALTYKAVTGDLSGRLWTGAGDLYEATTQQRAHATEAFDRNVEDAKQFVHEVRVQVDRYRMQLGWHAQAWLIWLSELATQCREDLRRLNIDVATGAAVLLLIYVAFHAVRMIFSVDVLVVVGLIIGVFVLYNRFTGAPAFGRPNARAHRD
mmetsp:Transcript_11625/g.35505  ORF Transcript_11625/g.35505 Transcript_11625/m.35505 type:complete len:503 (+) Transcript_11625:170-1678(+)